MAEIREISEEWTEICKELIENEPELAHLKNGNADIVYLTSAHEKKSKGRKVFGLTEKVSSKNQWAIPADFTITFYETNIVLNHFTDEQRKILAFHELLHVGMRDDETFYTVPHDLEDFRLIVDKYGAFWDKDPTE